MKLDADWLTAAPSRAVMRALDGQGYFVGGCVRNALFRVPVSDIDIATPLVPDAVLARLEAAGIKAIPTGLQHGTVTAVHDHSPIEITTFRRDVATDGRHAEVAFTREMAEDAARRDFTMNALYADLDGEVLDPLGGLPDLQARRVRFIGDAGDRIREDYLRILRFFRFHAWYGAEGIDPTGLAACAELAGGMDRLARERIGWEMRKLLSAPDPAPAVGSMAQSGVLLHALPGANPMLLPVVVHLEQAHGYGPDWLRRLAALGGEAVVEALRLSRAEARALVEIGNALEEGRSIAEIAYRRGGDIARSAGLLRAAFAGSEGPASLEQEILAGERARFPLAARDLVALGVEAGPRLGEVLQQAERAWIDSGFTLDKAGLLRQVGF